MDPTIQKIVDSISEERISARMRKLETFGTRNTFYESADPTKGPQAARQWIFDEFKSFSPRLQVKFDKSRVKKFGARFFRDADVVNIVATLPGKKTPERQFVVSAHYDTIHIARKPGTNGGDPEIDGEKSALEAIAPGVIDDGSGTAAVLELARVMSQYEFDSTIIFITFDCEEYGLVGSNLYATRAKAEKQNIEAVLNNDIIGSDHTDDGHYETHRVHVFSPDPADSTSRSLARYLKEVGERYVPSMTVELVFRHDRFARGGDHTPFNQEGFTAVRITSAAENLKEQHTADDTFDRASPAYTTRVAKLNAAALANLALAPKAPVVTRVIETGANKGQTTTLLARGKSGFAAQLRWRNEKPEDDLAGYKVLVRSTLAPLWEREIYVGNVTEYVMESVSIDDITLGVQAVDQAGHESLASTFVAAPGAKVKLETVEAP